MIPIPVRLAALSCLLISAAVSAQTESRYKARLSTMPIDFVNAPAVTGSGSVSAVLTGTSLKVSGTFDGLAGLATIAQVHRGPLGIRGPVVFDLTIANATKGTIEGTIELKPNQVEDLKRGRLYIQIHSDKAPDGNLWGWLLNQES
jgi:CHRD domain